MKVHEVLKDIGYEIEHLGDLDIYPGLKRREYEAALVYYRLYKEGDFGIERVMPELRSALGNDDAFKRAFGQWSIFYNPSGSV